MRICKFISCYRSVGISELNALLNGESIFGRYDNSSEPQNTSDLQNVVACFEDKIRWDDKYHRFFLELCVPVTAIAGYGTGTYYASKKFAKTKIWTGRRGSVRYDLKEIYLPEYDIRDVVSINNIGIEITRMECPDKSVVYTLTAVGGKNDYGDPLLMRCPLKINIRK